RLVGDRRGARRVLSPRRHHERVRAGAAARGQPWWRHSLTWGTTISRSSPTGPSGEPRLRAPGQWWRSPRSAADGARGGHSPRAALLAAGTDRFRPSADGHEALLLDAPDVITDRIDVALVVTGQQDGPPLLPQLRQQDTDPMDAGFIKAVERFVQQEQALSFHEGLGDGELLLHAERVVADLLRGFRIQTDSLHRSRGLVLGDQAADAGQIDEISQPCHTADIGGPVDDDPHVGRKVPPVALQRRFQLNDSLIGSVQPDDHLEEDRLPGAVGALQPRYRPGPDLHRGVLEQGELAELLGDVTEDDRGSVHRLLSGWGRSRFGRVHRATISNRGKRRARRSSSIPNTRTVLAASAAVVGCSHAPSPPLATGAGHTGLTSGS